MQGSEEVNTTRSGSVRDPMSFALRPSALSEGIDASQHAAVSLAQREQQAQRLLLAQSEPLRREDSTSDRAARRQTHRQPASTQGSAGTHGSAVAYSSVKYSSALVRGATVPVAAGGAAASAPTRPSVIFEDLRGSVSSALSGIPANPIAVRLRTLPASASAFASGEGPATPRQSLTRFASIPPHSSTRESQLPAPISVPSGSAVSGGQRRPCSLDTGHSLPHKQKQARQLYSRQSSLTSQQEPAYAQPYARQPYRRQSSGTSQHEQQQGQSGPAFDVAPAVSSGEQGVLSALSSPRPRTLSTAQSIAASTAPSAASAMSRRSSQEQAAAQAAGLQAAAAAQGGAGGWPGEGPRVAATGNGAAAAAGGAAHGGLSGGVVPLEEEHEPEGSNHRTQARAPQLLCAFAVSQQQQHHARIPTTPHTQFV